MYDHICSNIEPIATKLVVKQVEHYREQWMKEHEHYKVISRDVSELKEDVSLLKTEVKEISGVFIPQTQKEMGTMKQGKLCMPLLLVCNI